MYMLQQCITVKQASAWEGKSNEAGVMTPRYKCGAVTDISKLGFSCAMSSTMQDKARQSVADHPIHVAPCACQSHTPSPFVPARECLSGLCVAHSTHSIAAEMCRH